jgi:hypothetical protein
VIAWTRLARARPPRRGVLVQRVHEDGNAHPPAEELAAEVRALEAEGLYPLVIRVVREHRRPRP